MILLPEQTWNCHIWHVAYCLWIFQSRLQQLLRWWMPDRSRTSSSATTTLLPTRPPSTRDPPSTICVRVSGPLLLLPDTLRSTSWMTMSFRYHLFYFHSQMFHFFPFSFSSLCLNPSKKKWKRKCNVYLSLNLYTFFYCILLCHSYVIYIVIAMWAMNFCLRTIKFNSIQFNHWVKWRMK